MKRHNAVIKLAVVLTSASFALPALAQSGMEIMEEQKKRHESSSEETRSTMKLIDRRGREKEREMVTYTLKEDSGLAKSVLKFLGPADIRNTGLLTWEQPTDKEDDQWLYLPATKQVKRVTGSSKKNPFMGSDLAFEDLRPENLGAHTYEVTGEEDIDGQTCWVMDVLPSTDKEKSDSGYSKRIFWVRQDNYLTVKTEFYNRSDRLDKVGTFTGLEQVEGDMWRAKELRVERMSSKTQTVWSFTERQVNHDIDTNLFTQQGLRRPPSR